MERAKRIQGSGTGARFAEPRGGGLFSCWAEGPSALFAETHCSLESKRDSQPVLPRSAPPSPVQALPQKRNKFKIPVILEKPLDKSNLINYIYQHDLIYLNTKQTRRHQKKDSRRLRKKTCSGEERP